MISRVMLVAGPWWQRDLWMGRAFGANFSLVLSVFRIPTPRRDEGSRNRSPTQSAPYVRYATDRARTVLLSNSRPFSTVCQRLILPGATNIERKQPDLKGDQRIRMVVPAPGDPQNVAHQKTPKAPTALSLGLGRYEPCCRQRDNHCRPLQRVNKAIHGCSDRFFPSPDANWGTNILDVR